MALGDRQRKEKILQLQKFAEEQRKRREKEAAQKRKEDNANKPSKPTDKEEATLRLLNRASSPAQRRFIQAQIDSSTVGLKNRQELKSDSLNTEFDILNTENKIKNIGVKDFDPSSALADTVAAGKLRKIEASAPEDRQNTILNINRQPRRVRTNREVEDNATNKLLQLLEDQDDLISETNIKFAIPDSSEATTPESSKARTSKITAIDQSKKNLQQQIDKFTDIQKIAPILDKIDETFDGAIDRVTELNKINDLQATLDFMKETGITKEELVQIIQFIIKDGKNK